MLDSRDVARIEIDTELDKNRTGLRSASQVESVIARMDAVVTTRLHGTVLALKNGVPPLVIDPIGGGRKVLAQARAIGWRTVYTADDLDAIELSRALDFCLSPQWREEANRVRASAKVAVEQIRLEFVAQARTVAFVDPS